MIPLRHLCLVWLVVLALTPVNVFWIVERQPIKVEDMIMLAVLLAVVSLAGICGVWATLGTAPWQARTAASMAAIFVCGCGTPWEDTGISGVQLIGMALCCLPIRWQRYRWQRLTRAELQQGAATPGPLQFSIAQIFGLTTAVALIVAILPPLYRWLDTSGPVGFLAVPLGFAVASAAAVYLARFGRRPRENLAVAAGVAAVLASSFFVLNRAAGLVSIGLQLALLHYAIIKTFERRGLAIFRTEFQPLYLRALLPPARTIEAPTEWQAQEKPTDP